MIRHPDTAPAIQDAFVSILDVGATLFSLVDAALCPGRPRAGRDLLPLLGPRRRPADWPQVAYGEYDLYNGMSFAIRAVRDERFKYVWNPQAVDELYDLETDPCELRNRANDPDIAVEKVRLRRMLFDWMRATGDDLVDRAPNLPAAGTIVATSKPGP